MVRRVSKRRDDAGSAAKSLLRQWRQQFQAETTKPKTSTKPPPVQVLVEPIEPPPPPKPVEAIADPAYESALAKIRTDTASAHGITTTPPISLGPARLTLRPRIRPPPLYSKHRQGLSRLEQDGQDVFKRSKSKTAVYSGGRRLASYASFPTLFELSMRVRADSMRT